MSRATIDYMNARREHLRSRNGGSQQDWSAEYAPDCEREPFDIAMSAINSFVLWAQGSRQRYLEAAGIRETEPETDIPF